MVFEYSNGLSKIFLALKAEHPEGWVRSEINENIAQLSRFLILQYIEREIISAQENH